MTRRQRHGWIAAVLLLALVVLTCPSCATFKAMPAPEKAAHIGGALGVGTSVVASFSPDRFSESNPIWQDSDGDPDAVKIVVANSLLHYGVHRMCKRGSHRIKWRQACRYFGWSWAGVRGARGIDNAITIAESDRD